VLGELEQPGHGDIAAVGRVLHDELRSRAVGGGEQDGGAARDLVRLLKFAAMRSGDVGEPEDVVTTLAYDGWTRLAVTRLEEARDRVGAARRGGEDGEILSAAHAVVQVGEEGVVKDIVSFPPSIDGVAVDHVRAEPSAS
jgi:hypothetical protein